MNDSKLLLKIAVERGYLGPRVARHVLRMVKAQGRPAEQILLREKILSDRRVDRLVTHRRYRTMRKADKAYALLAIKKEMLTKGQVMASFQNQRHAFEQSRVCVRVGADLIDRGLLTVAQDRVLRAEAHGTKLPSEMLPVSDVASSEATLALHEASKTGAGALLDDEATSYRVIDDAVRRVDALRAMKQDLSTSDNVGVDAATTARRDSANEIENALTVLARRRHGVVTSDITKPARRKTKKKSTGLMRIFNLAG